MNTKEKRAAIRYHAAKQANDYRYIWALASFRSRTPLYYTDGEHAVKTLSIRCNKTTAAYLMDRETLPAMIEEGLIAPYGCHCSHCLNDWDCCGNMFVWRNKIKRTRRGVKITQYFSRNI